MSDPPTAPAPAPAPAPAKKPAPGLVRFLPILLIAAGFIAFFALDGPRYVSFEALAQQREALRGFVEANLVLAALLYILAYAVVVAFSLPLGAVMTISSGFFFGLWLGGSLTVIGATLGATAIFLAARTAFSDLLRAKAGKYVERLEAGFREDGFSYLLILRLVPLFPFWLINLVPAFLGISTGAYMLATFLGIIPGTFVYASLGNGLGAILDAGGTPDLSIVFDLEVLGPILGLAALAAVPVLYKKWKKGKADEQAT